ncbi:TPA: hypothetical protein ACH3X1_010871 [Trebouxia sp. C0004]
MVTAYDFEDEEQRNDLGDVGKKLLACKSKDTLVKLLKQAGEVLDKTSQTDAGAKLASKGIAKAIVQKTVLDHKDKDVRVCAAYCLSHILKIHAPDSPYSTTQLQDVFVLFMWVFRRLENPSSPSYQLTLSVLDNISQIKCCLLMLDFDNDEMVCDMFKVMLGTVNGANHESVEPAMLEIMASMIEEADDVSQPLLDVILECVTSPKMEEQPQAYRLAQQLLHRAEDRLQRYLQRFLNNIILGHGTDSSLQEEDYPTLIYQIHLACPQTLLPVLPLLIHELQVEVEAKRLDAIDVLGKLFTMPGSDMDQEYSYLFEEFLRRCKDQKIEVRLRVIHYSKTMLGSCSQASSAKVLEAVLERLQDFEDKVRSRAIITICEAAIAFPEAVTLQALEAVSARLRDKKLPVRKEAALQLAAVFRAYCNRSQDVMTPDEERAIWIPGRLLTAATRDPDLFSFMLDTVLRNGLFPARLGSKAAAGHLAVVFMNCGEQERIAVLAVLRAKARQQQDVQSFLTVRADKSPSESPFAAGHDARVGQAIRRVAAAFPDSARADEALQKIHEMRDGHIFKGLATLCAPGTDPEAAAKVAKDTVQRIGSKGFAGEFARCVCARLSPNLIAPEHLRGLLEVAAEEAGDREDNTYLTAVLDLLVGCAASAPALFADLGYQVAGLLESKDVKVATAAASILIHAARPMLQSHTKKDDKEEEEEDLAAKLKPLLLQLVSCGTPKAAKVAIRALSKVLKPESATATFQNLAKKLIALLQKPSATASPALPAALKALGTLGQVVPAVFAEHACSMADFVLDDLLEAPMSSLSPSKARHLRAPVEGKTGASPHQGIVLKMLGLKALATACVSCGPDQPADTKLATARVVDQLMVLVNPENDLDHVGTNGPIDEGCVRLATANALLKLAKSQENPVSADVYLQLALTMQDPIMEVRHQFAVKVHQMVQDFQKDPTKGHKAAKWAAVFPLAAMDPTQANCQAAFSFLMEFVAIRRRAVQHRVSAAAANQSSGGTMLHEYPDFILPFIIQSLAHHPDFPTPEDLDEGDLSVLEPFQKMLQFALQPLLLYVDPIADQPGSVLPVVQKILRTLKHTEDATLQDATPNIYMLCDMALAMASALAKKQQPVKGKGSVSAAASHPGSVPLPSSFYKSLDLQTAGRKADGSHLPDCFQLQLTDFLPKQPLLNSVGKANQKEVKGRGQGKVPNGEVKGRGGKGRAAGAGGKRPSDEHKEGGSNKKPRRRKAAESEESEAEQSDDDASMAGGPSPKAPFSPPLVAVSSPGQKAKAKAASRSPASPIKSVGSGSISKNRGTKQAGRRRSRESKEAGSMELGSEGEEEDEPSPKRVNKGKLPTKLQASPTPADTKHSPASPSAISPSKAKVAAGKATQAAARKATAAKATKAATAKAAKPKAGRKGKQAAAQESDGDGDEEQEPVVEAKAQKPSRKGKQAPSEQADGQQRKATPAPAKGQDRGQKQQRVNGSKQRITGSGNEQQTGNAAAVPPVSQGKQQPTKRGRKALSDNRAEQDDGEAAASQANTTAVDSPKRKGAAVREDQKAAPKGQKALPTGQKAASKGQDKAHPAAKAKPAAKRHQPG